MTINVQGTTYCGLTNKGIDNAHHAIVKWMLYKHGSFSLGYVFCALPITALVGGHIEVTADDVMVCNILEHIKFRGYLVRWIYGNIR